MHPTFSKLFHRLTWTFLFCGKSTVTRLLPFSNIRNSGFYNTDLWAILFGPQLSATATATLSPTCGPRNSSVPTCQSMGEEPRTHLRRNFPTRSWSLRLPDKSAESPRARRLTLAHSRGHAGRERAWRRDRRRRRIGWSARGTRGEAIAAAPVSRPYHNEWLF